MLTFLLVFGKDFFNLPYEVDTPFYYQDDSKELSIATNKTIIYTMVFQSFVFMCVFNEINSRKLGTWEFNVFAGIFGNYVFLFIIILTLVVQDILC